MHDRTDPSANFVRPISFKSNFIKKIMNTGEIIFASINIGVLIITAIAVWRAPIKAIKIGQQLQHERQKSDRLYQNKFIIFAAILGNRHAKGYSENFVIAMNQIPIIFNQNAKVIIALDKFIAKHNETARNEEDRGKMLNNLLNDLVLKMAADLGYDNVDNDLMTSYFYPGASYNSFEASSISNEMYVLEHQKKLFKLRKEKDSDEISNKPIE